MMMFVAIAMLVLGSACGWFARQLYETENRRERLLREIARVRSEGHLPGAIVRIWP